MDVRCPYCRKLLLRELLGRVTTYCRGCKRELTLRRDRPGGPVILESSSD